MTESSKELILHIGQHKTGSKALQSFLAGNTRLLAGRGILYPLEGPPPKENRAYARSHFRLFVLLRRQAMMESGDSEAAESFWRRNQPFCGFFKSLDELFDSYGRRMSRFKADRLLLSAEDLFDSHTADETDFQAKWLKAAVRLLAGQIEKRGYQLKVVVYLRRQDHLLAAHYSQFIKGSGTHHQDFKSFAQSFAPRLRSRELLQYWAAAFGAEKIVVRPYERQTLPDGILPDFFERGLGFALPSQWRRPPADPETVNRTPSRDFIEFMRGLNLRLGENQTSFPRRWVLQAALKEPERQVKLSDWFSAAEQMAFLESYEAGNSEIAAQFLGPEPKPLFKEPAPAVRDEKAPTYPGLTPQREAEITQLVRNLRSRDRQLRWGLRAAVILLGLSLTLLMLNWMRA